MNEQWKHITINDINGAVYVAPNTGKLTHKDRPFHGFVLNDSDSVKDYVFDDGRVMRTKGDMLFYLPQGSSYHVETLHAGGCYAINFYASVTDEPFAISLRNIEEVLRNFKTAATEWQRKDDTRRMSGMRAIYDAIDHMQKEQAKQYVSGTQLTLLSPALEVIEQRFTKNELTVPYLANLCGISDAYFRRLFFNQFGISPKEYIIQKRIEYAKTLLLSGLFSISEIAVMCGYAEPCHFSREFSKRVGVSPSQYTAQ